MRRVNLSMLMLLCFVCAAMFYLIAAQQSLTNASALNSRESVVNADGGDTYFITATQDSRGEPLRTIGTEAPNDTRDLDGDGIVFLDELASPEPRATDQISINATPTRTPTPVNIGNFVWDDLDQDGRQDAGEPGMSNVIVQVWNSTKNLLIDSDVTDANGIYTVTTPGPGNFRVRVILPNVNDQFSPKNEAGGNDSLDSDINPSGTHFGFTDTIAIADNVISTTIVDAGIIKFRTPTPTRTPTPVNFGNFIWDDLDQDGRQDAGEPGLSNVTVQLWNDAMNDLIDTDVTDANGIYTLQSPGPGAYRVRVILPNGNDQFSPKDQAGGDDLLDSDINPSSPVGFTDILNIASNVISITSIDGGIIKFRTPTPTRTPTPINVGNFVWDDLDGDGRQDAGEPGIEGVTMQLYNASNVMIFETETNASGIYTLIAPVPGNYRVRAIKPSSADDFTLKDQAGGNDQLDSDANATGYTDTYVFASNLISITTIDIGIITAEPVNVGDRVWFDSNGNGSQTAGELGLAGRRVRLRRQSLPFDVTVSSVLTNANGTYMAVAPEAGDYYMCVTIYTGESLTIQNANDGQVLPDLRDSDVSPTATGNGLGCTADFSVAVAGFFNSSYDAGFDVVYASIIGQVTLQGHGATPSNQWIVPLRVRVVPAGGGASVFDGYVMTNNSGQFVTSGASPNGIPPGDYDIWVKHDHTLGVVITTTLDPGNNAIDFGVLLEGDASNDNFVTISDFSVLASTYGASEGDPTYDARADFNNDTTISISDFSMLATNFGLAGDDPP